MDLVNKQCKEDTVMNNHIYVEADLYEMKRVKIGHP